MDRVEEKKEEEDKDWGGRGGKVEKSTMLFLCDRSMITEGAQLTRCSVTEKQPRSKT